MFLHLKIKKINYGYLIISDNQSNTLSCIVKLNVCPSVDTSSTRQAPEATLVFTHIVTNFKEFQQLMPHRVGAEEDSSLKIETCNKPIYFMKTAFFFNILTQGQRTFTFEKYDKSALSYMSH